MRTALRHHSKKRIKAIRRRINHCTAELIVIQKHIIVIANACLYGVKKYVFTKIDNIIHDGIVNNTRRRIEIQKDFLLP